MTTVIIGLVIVVLGTLGYIALRNAQSFEDANEVIPGVPTNAPKEWAGAHTTEARLHRRLRDAMTALRANRSLDAADLVSVREAVEQEALALDDRLVAVAALPGRHKADKLEQVERAVSAIEGVVADVVGLRGPAVEDLEIGLAGVRTRIALVREARAELAELGGASPDLERLRADLDQASSPEPTAPASDPSPSPPHPAAAANPPVDPPVPSKGIALPGSAARMARRLDPQDLAESQRERSEAERLRAEFQEALRRTAAESDDPVAGDDATGADGPPGEPEAGTT